MNAIYQIAPPVRAEDYARAARTLEQAEKVLQIIWNGGSPRQALMVLAAASAHVMALSHETDQLRAEFARMVDECVVEIARRS